MATAAAVQTAVAKGVIQTLWTITAANETGAAEAAPQFPLKTVTVSGTWGGGTIVIEESGDGTNWATAINAQGAAVSFTADGAMVVASNAKYHRPRATVNVTSVVVALLSTSSR